MLFSEPRGRLNHGADKRFLCRVLLQAVGFQGVSAPSACGGENRAGSARRPLSLSPQEAPGYTLSADRPGLGRGLPRKQA